MRKNNQDESVSPLVAVNAGGVVGARTSMRPNGTELSEIPEGLSLQRRLGGAQRRLSGGGEATPFR